MKYLHLALYWLFAVIFGLAGLGLIFTLQLAALPLILLSMFLLPPVRKFFHAKTNRSLSNKAKGWIIVFLLVVFAVLAGISEQEEEIKEAIAKRKRTTEYYYSHRDSILGVIDDAIQTSQYDAALLIIEKYSMSEDSMLVEAKTRLVALTKEAEQKKREQDILQELKGIPASQAKRNLDLYKKLREINPSNNLYTEKVEYYSARYREQIKAKEEKQRKARITAARKERIESQFSAWNGAHRNLERLIKESMNDPDSFKHAETVYWDKGDHLIVKTTFRGRNAFGGMVINSVTAKVNLDGQILEIISQN